MKALILSTFVLENYGEPTKPWWKPKGGNEYWLCQVDTDGELDETIMLNGFGELISHFTTRDNPMYIELTHSIRLMDTKEAQLATVLSDENYDPINITDTSRVVYSIGD